MVTLDDGSLKRALFGDNLFGLYLIVCVFSKIFISSSLILSLNVFLVLLIFSFNAIFYGTTILVIYLPGVIIPDTLSLLKSLIDIFESF